MKISHTVLETCRNNPALWAASQLEAGSGASFGFNAALLCAIHDFHKGTGNEKQATQRLVEMLDKNFKDQKRIDSTLLNLQKYLDWFTSQNIQVADSRFLYKPKLRVALDSRWPSPPPRHNR
jgi:phosphomannomutase